ncbi:MAG: TauD/TfdA family dioxygenase, partial [Verrucomicrobiota bacterium]
MTSSDPQPFEHSANWRDQQLLTRDDWMISIDDAERIQQVQQNLEHGSGAALIRGYDSSGKSDEENRQFFLEFASRIGTPISQSAGGDLIFSVRDEGFGEKDPRTRGPNTSKKLSFHTDRCDVIAFLCLSQAREGGENEIVSSIAVYNEILKRRPDLLQQLLEPYYYKRHNV